MLMIETVYTLLLAAASFVCLATTLNPNQRSSSYAYGGCAALMTAVGCLLSAAIVFCLVKIFSPMWQPLYYVLAAAAAAFCARRVWKMRRARARARKSFEEVVIFVCVLMASVAILATLGIVASVIFESVEFFRRVPASEFLFGLQWSPQIAIRDDQVGAAGAFGFVPLLVGTLLISFVALTFATPIGLLSAIYLAEFASPRQRELIKPILEVLAGVPTIIYGFFAVVILSPILVDIGDSIGVGIKAENALAAGLVMGVMLIPFIASLSEDAFHAVPESLRQGGLGLGSTRFETMTQIIFPAALPGVVAGFLLAFSRAIGETMIVVMAAGISANLTINPLEAVTTITVQIVSLLTGDQEFDDAKTLAAFALGLVLFAVTLVFNFFALRMAQKYQKRYE